MFDHIGRLWDLLEVSNCGLKQMHVKFTGDILIKTLAPAFRMSHLTEYTTIRRADALDGKGRIVGIEVDIAGRIAGEINILCSDLSVFRQFVDDCIRG